MKQTKSDKMILTFLNIEFYRWPNGWHACLVCRSWEF